jgi:hypothetical protein
MNPLKQKLIDEQPSPLFRIMSVYDDLDAQRRKFDGNINAFHIGKGYILSVAHYLRSRFPLVRSTPEAFFQAQILAKFPVNETNQLLRHYPADSSTNRRYLTLSDEKTAQKLIKKFLDYKCDTAVQNLYTHGVCKPFLIVQSKNSQLFNDAQVTAQLDQRHVFQELALNRYTFLLELKVVKVFLEYDIAIYRTINVPPAVVRLLPSISLDYSSYDDDCTGLHCLQNSPSGTNLGRLLNRAQIEGILDQHSIQGDPVSGNYIFEGLRYLIRGYFRFGSSGAPYVKFDGTSNQFAAIALQSEACPIQLTINNNQEGNNQWINAIATPLFLIADEIREFLRQEPAVAAANHAGGVPVLRLHTSNIAD